MTGKQIEETLERNAKNIGDEYEEQTIDLGSPLLKKFDLHYYDENGEEIPNE